MKVQIGRYKEWALMMKERAKNKGCTDLINGFRSLIDTLDTDNKFSFDIKRKST